MRQKISIKVKKIYDYDKHYINCPFCEKEIGPEFDGDSTYGDIQTCEHTLFIAVNEGFEFCDKRVKENLSIPLDEDINKYVEKFVGDPDSITNRIDLPGYIKIYTYTGSDHGIGVYYGFME